MSDINDRAVQALIDDGWIGDWDDPVDETHLTQAVALVLRVVRDDLALAELYGQIRRPSDVLDVLNERIYGLTGKQTNVGDTTEQRVMP